MTIHNIAVYPADTEIGLEINNALKHIKLVNLIGVSPTNRHGRFVFKNFIGDFSNPSDNQHFIREFNQIINRYNIKFIYPASDEMALYFAIHEFELNAEVIGSDITTNRIARSKKKTAIFFNQEAFMPKTYLDAKEVTNFPVFLKPSVGSGSYGISIANNREQLERKLHENQGEYIISEYLPGNEYTIDCFTDQKGQLKFTGYRERKAVRSGITVNTLNSSIPSEVQTIAEAINQKLVFRGAWFFQVKRNQLGQFRLLEFATRIAGTMCLYRNQGVNLPLLSVYDRLDYPIQIQQNSFNLEVDRALSNKFRLEIDYQTVVVDFDDTITRNNDLVNPAMMYLIYQWQNRNKSIVLLTRHQSSIKKTLEKLNISETLFDEIITLKDFENKGTHVARYDQPIFIDDSFGERQQVMNIARCPVFDTGSIESLMDWQG